MASRYADLLQRIVARLIHFRKSRISATHCPTSAPPSSTPTESLPTLPDCRPRDIHPSPGLGPGLGHNGAIFRHCRSVNPPLAGLIAPPLPTEGAIELNAPQHNNQVMKLILIIMSAWRRIRRAAEMRDSPARVRVRPRLPGLASAGCRNASARLRPVR